MGTATVSAAVKGAANLNGAMKSALVLVTMSATYATGGDTVDLSVSGNLGINGFKTVTGMIFAGQATAADTKYLPVFIPASSDGTSPKIKVHDTSAAADAEVTNATDLSLVVFRFLVIGT